MLYKVANDVMSGRPAPAQGSTPPIKQDSSGARQDNVQTTSPTSFSSRAPLDITGGSSGGGYSFNFTGNNTADKVKSYLTGGGNPGSLTLGNMGSYSVSHPSTFGSSFKRPVAPNLTSVRSDQQPSTQQPTQATSDDPNDKAFMRSQIDDYKAGIGPSIYSHADQATQWQNVDRQYRPTGWSLYGDLPLYRNYSYLTSQFGNLSTATQDSQYQRQQRQVQDAQFKKDHSDIYNSPEYKQMTSSPEYKQKLQASQQKIDQQYAPTEKYLQHWQNVADSMKRSQEIMNRQDTQVANENTTIQNMAGQMGSGFNKDNPMDVVHYMDQQLKAKRQAAESATGDEKAKLDAEVKSLQSATLRARSQAVDAAKKDPNLMSDFAFRHGRHNVGTTLMDDSVTKPYYNQVLKDQQAAFRAKEQVENSGI